MFSGLIREIGRIVSISKTGELSRLRIEAPLCAADLASGDSLAVNGICLTVTRPGSRDVVVEAVAETRRITTLGDWRSGDRVHLEPALRAGDPLGGHLVLGHVDGVGRIKGLRKTGGALVMTLSAPPTLGEWLLPKGSIAVDGVSLTLDEVPTAGRFQVSLIPHTLQWTRFGGMRVGDAVNLETDILAKGAARHADAAGWINRDETSGGRSGLSVQDILDKGFRRNR